MEFPSPYAQTIYRQRQAILKGCRRRAQTAYHLEQPRAPVEIAANLRRIGPTSRTPGARSTARSASRKEKRRLTQWPGAFQFFRAESERGRAERVPRHNITGR